MPAGSLQCPTCGAAATPDASRCNYCGTRLATVQCAACFRMMFVGSKFCPHCGAPAATKRAADLPKLACPRCRSKHNPREMEPSTLRNVQIDECPACSGVWIDHATFRCICTNAQAQAAVLDLLAAPPRGVTEHVVSYLHCPLCEQLMARRNYARRSGVIVDFCPTDGLWFDRDELRHIVEFIRTGGLRAAARADAERAAADRELKENERRWLGGSPWPDDSDQPPRTLALLNLLFGSSHH